MPEDSKQAAQQPGCIYGQDEKLSRHPPVPEKGGVAAHTQASGRGHSNNRQPISKH